MVQNLPTRRFQASGAAGSGASQAAGRRSYARATRSRGEWPRLALGGAALATLVACHVGVASSVSPGGDPAPPAEADELDATADAQRRADAGVDADPASRPQATAPTCPAPTRGGSSGAASTAQDPLRALRATHPRVFVTAESVARTKAILASGDPVARAMLEKLSRKVKEIVAQPAATYVTDSSEAKRLKASPVVNERVLALGAYYLLTGDRAAAERARGEMLAAAAFPDWHPPHFLDTAVMAHALGVGYDWLFDFLSPADRATIRAAIVQKGLAPGLASYEQRAWWTTSAYNWALVCGGGLAVGALGVADEALPEAERIVKHALASVAKPIGTYAPDGAWPEGPMYWGYGTMYLVSLVAALDSAVGTDFGLSAAPALAKTALFRMNTIGPTKKAFSFGDAGESAGSAEIMMWLARRYTQPLFAKSEHDLGGLGAVRALLWYEPGCLAPSEALPEADSAYPRRELALATLRSRWNDPSATYVGVKGGDNATPHGHLDLGSFVLDAGGTRWALDLGSDSYELPGYFDTKTGARFAIYRVGTEAHNTLTIARTRQQPLAFANQAATAKAPLVAFAREAGQAFAVVDLTEAYAPLVSRVQRGVLRVGDGLVIVQDEVSAREDVDIVWSFHTRAKIAREARSARLSDGDKVLRAEILEPTGAAFEVVTANPRVADATSAENPNAGVQNLIVRLPSLTRSTRIVVRLALSGVTTPTPAVRPLAEWIERGRL